MVKTLAATIIVIALILIVSFWGLFGYVTYEVVTKPEAVGEFVGKVQNGYQGETQ